MIREKWRQDDRDICAEIEENKVTSFGKSNQTMLSFRVYDGESAGIHHQMSEMEDGKGFALAEKNLEKKRPYPFAPESGKGSRDKTEKPLSDRELLDTARECLDWIVRKYPRYVFTGSFSQTKIATHWVNDAGMDLFNADCAVSVGMNFKHVDSRDIVDGNFSFSLRTFDRDVFCRMAEDYLEHFERTVELPEEVIIDMQYYGLLGILVNALSAEELALGTSLLTGKLGQQVFSKDFTLMDDVTDEECWFNPFWDGEGCVQEGGKLLLIDKGVAVTGYANKRIARKYGAPHTRSAAMDWGDIPGSGCKNLRITRSPRTIKELLGGRPCVIPVLTGGGGFNDKGDYVAPVHCSLLYDGEQVVGKLPPFIMRSSMFDMFGKDFIGVGADDPIYHDKQILFRVRVEKMV